jgi:hypothetical protein
VKFPSSFPSNVSASSMPAKETEEIKKINKVKIDAFIKSPWYFNQYGAVIAAFGLIDKRLTKDGGN